MTPSFLLPPHPHMCCIISQSCCVAAQTSAASVPVPACLQIPLRRSWLLSSVICLCQIWRAASANHSVFSASTPWTHHQNYPSPGLQGAAPPPIIVLRTERYQDLISPTSPLAGGTNDPSVWNNYQGKLKGTRDFCFCQALSLNCEYIYVSVILFAEYY